MLLRVVTTIIWWFSTKITICINRKRWRFRCCLFKFKFWLILVGLNWSRRNWAIEVLCLPSSDPILFSKGNILYKSLMVFFTRSEFRYRKLDLPQKRRNRFHLLVTTVLTKCRTEIFFFHLSFLEFLHKKFSSLWLKILLNLE